MENERKVEYIDCPECGRISVHPYQVILGIASCRNVKHGLCPPILFVDETTEVKLRKLQTDRLYKFRFRTKASPEPRGWCTYGP